MSRQLVVAGRVVTARGQSGDALLIEDGVVAAVGLASELREQGLIEHHYPAKTISPGLRDAHFHPLVYTAALSRLSLRRAADIEEVVSMVAAASAELPPGEPLLGMRLDDESLAEGRLPDRTDLDRAAGERPVLLHRYCGHVAVANTAALQVSGVGTHTPDPKGGSLDRDPLGLPTGVLRETAVRLVGRALAPLAAGPTSDRLLQSLHGLLRLGLTSIGAIISSELDPWCGASDELEIMVEAASELPLNVSVLVVADSAQHLNAAASRLDGRSPRLRFLGLKDFADGSLGGHTAALREPYADRPDLTGTLRLDPRRVLPLAEAALGLGAQVALHAIGDRANTKVLDVFEELVSRGADPNDLRIEHASVLADEDVARMAALGVTASVQPAFLASETTWLGARLGADRLTRTYPFATLERAGVPLAGGSDCPVEPPSPLWGIAAARDRAGMIPAEGLDPGRALALFTDGAARVMREPPPLAPGSPADFIVLDVDPLKADPEALRRADVEAVWLDGKPADLPPEAPLWPG